jgi:hypothetical protein
MLHNRIPQLGLRAVLHFSVCFFDRVRAANAE